MKNNDIVKYLKCPCCRAEMTVSEDEKSLFCTGERRHCFDFSSKGYVNLAGSRGVTGDSKAAVQSRTDFLNRGYYEPIADMLVDILKKYKSQGLVVDAGCGEGFYTSHIRDALGEGASVYGIDVSRDAIHAAAKDRKLRLAVASIFDLPAENESVDILVNLFAPYDAKEFSRVLKKGGTLVRVFPREKHLWELKCAVYDTPYENEIDTLALEGFSLLEKREITFPLDLHKQEYIDTLFKMTPYYYKTSREGQSRLAALDSLQTHAEFLLVVYTRN